MRTKHPNSAMLSAGLISAALGLPVAAIAGCNPCAARTRTTRSANPCAAKNPCAARNPCALKAITRPAGYSPYKGNTSELVAAGERLFKDTSLSTNGLACATCHTAHGAFQPSFAQPYPHFVQMAADNYGLKEVHLDEMVQLCMLGPMAAKPLDWKSRELAALVAYTETQQKTFKPSKAAPNPCAAKSAGAAKR